MATTHFTKRWKLRLVLFDINTHIQQYFSIHFPQWAVKESSLRRNDKSFIHFIYQVHAVSCCVSDKQNIFII